MLTQWAISQEVPITNYAINDNGQVELQVNSDDDHYYILQVRHDVNDDFEIEASMTLGESGTTVITEVASAYPLEHYRVLQHDINAPADTDGDGLDDISEFQNTPDQSPLNPATSIQVEDGMVMLSDFSDFINLSVQFEDIQWSEFLNGKEFVKFIISDINSNPQIYFINSENHNLHQDFSDAVGIENFGDEVRRGQITFHPTLISNNGSVGTFAFNYSNGYPQEFDIVQKSYDIIAANVPFLQNNLSFYVTTNFENQYNLDFDLYQDSRIPILLESDAFADVDYWGINQAEGYGFFKHMTLGEIPGSKDIVLYDALPNSLPRVGGIITSVIQTPLSHVNLRAIQNNIPNAFIRDPLNIDTIANLLDHYIYFKVEEDSYTIREATVEEVNAWYEDLRPDEEQMPPLNLDYTEILALNDIGFGMYDGYGAKCSNLATMRTFGFPEGTIPNGFGVPFYYYQEFMEYNNLFTIVESMINNPNFQSDRNVRDDMLDDFRDLIKNSNMPPWMMDNLAEMHASFPAGTSVRCRSSSNNEDLAGFNGAGLYTSKTQHPWEGHISKSIKQVYAGLWNLRAYEEREFYRINHFTSSMGVLCHPNFSDELANGVGVSLDPIYNTENTFYLNTQIGEDLITNPDVNSIPEEVLLNRYSDGGDGYTVIQFSSLAHNNTIIMDQEHMEQLREYLAVIHDEFKVLYNAANKENFAMDIEYKITSDNQLAIKQARPWVTYDGGDDTGVLGLPLQLLLYPNPAADFLEVSCLECALDRIQIHNARGQLVMEKNWGDNPRISLSIESLAEGIYFLSGIKNDGDVFEVRKFVKI